MIQPVKESRHTGSHRTRRQTKSSESASIVTTGFSDLLAENIEPASKTEATPEKYRNYHDLLDELNEFEQNLLNYPNDSNYDVYKKKVREIASRLLKDAYELKIFRDRNRREFEVLKTIDANLHEIFRNLMSHNPDLSAMLRSMGSIKGILFDLQV